MEKLHYNTFMAATLFTLALLAAGCAGNAAVEPGAAPANTTTTISLAEMAKHSTASDCWMAINGIVVDLTSYTNHPAGEQIRNYCGKDGTSAYNSIKGERGHSAYAGSLIERYTIGTLATG